MVKLILKTTILSVVFFGIGFAFLYFAKAWLPNENGLEAEGGEILTKEKWNSIVNNMVDWSTYDETSFTSSVYNFTNTSPAFDSNLGTVSYSGKAGDIVRVSYSARCASTHTQFSKVYVVSGNALGLTSTDNTYMSCGQGGRGTIRGDYYFKLTADGEIVFGTQRWTVNTYEGNLMNLHLYVVKVGHIN